MQLFIQRVGVRLCYLNNNGVIYPETICAQRSYRPSLLFQKGIQVQKKSNVKLLWAGTNKCVKIL